MFISDSTKINHENLMKCRLFFIMERRNNVNCVVNINQKKKTKTKNHKPQVNET